MSGGVKARGPTADWRMEKADGGQNRRTEECDIQIGGWKKGEEEPVPSLVKHFRGHKDTILSLMFHPSLPTVYSSGADGYIMAWNYQKEARALRFEGHDGPVGDICLSKDGDLLLSASADRTFRVWVPTIGGQYISANGHQGPVTSACFSPVDSTLFATGSTDKSVKLWSVQAARMQNNGVMNFRSHEFLQSYNPHRNWVRSVRFSHDGRLIVTASDDNMINVFDHRYTNPVCTLNCNVGSPRRAAFNPCGHTYVGVSTTAGAFLMFDIRQQKIVQSYTQLFSCPLTDFSFHPSGDFVVCVSEEPKIKILDLVEGRPVFTLYGPTCGLYATAFNSNGSLFATGGKDKEILIWEPNLVSYGNGDAEEVDAGEAGDENSIPPPSLSLSSITNEEGIFYHHSTGESNENLTGNASGNLSPPPSLRSLSLVANGEDYFDGYDAAGAESTKECGTHPPAESENDEDYSAVQTNGEIGTAESSEQNCDAKVNEAGSGTAGINEESTETEDEETVAGAHAIVEEVLTEADVFLSVWSPSSPHYSTAADYQFPGPTIGTVSSVFVEEE